jgi:hypothetical protein
MLTRLHQQTVIAADGSRIRPLAALTTREPADPTVALLDAAAVVFDVLGFYQERYGLETWLGTATERRSLVEIARGLGYEPAAGVAAAGWLAFTLVPGQDNVPIPVGAQLMAMPTGSQPPPLFETTAEVIGRAAFNKLSASAWLPKSRWPVRTATVRVAGISTRLRAGDVVLMLDADSAGPPATERFEFRRLLAAETEGDRTRLDLERPIGTGSGGSQVGNNHIARPVDTVYAFRGTASLFGASAADWQAQSEEAQRKYWIRSNRSPSTFVAPDDLSAQPPLTRALEWPGFPMAEDPAVRAGAIDLDREVPNLAPGSWLVLEGPGHVEAFQILRVKPVVRSQFGLNSRVHRVKLDLSAIPEAQRAGRLAVFDRRGTTVHLQSEALTRVGDPWLATEPRVGDEWTETTGGPEVPFPGLLDPSLVGRTVAVTGMTTSAAATGAVSAGVVSTVVSLRTEPDTTWVRLAATAPPMQRSTVRLYGNVAPATHGATAVVEALGSGSGAHAFQRMRIRQAPVTQVPDATAPRGVRTTAVVTVGGATWTEVPTLADAGPNDRVYQLQRDHDATTIVTFGDGVNGARLPTGAENVKATLRVGLGLTGNVAAGAASVMTRRPAGVESAINPLPFAGGADAESADNLRLSAAREVVAVDRLVSIIDYELFGRGFEGVAKATARAAWTGQRRLVHLTVAPPEGTVAVDATALLDRVRAAVRLQRDPEHTVIVDLPVQVPFGLSATLRAPADQDFATMSAAIRAALASAFGFEARGFAQPVTASELLAVMHTVAGVVAVDLDTLYRIEADGSYAPAYRDVLPAQPAVADGVNRRAAELLVISGSGAHVQIVRGEL